MDRQQFVILRRGSNFQSLNIHSDLPGAMTYGLLAPCGINEDMTHCFRGRGKEMSASCKLSLSIPTNRNHAS